MAVTATRAPKRARVRLARSELLAHLSMSADRWAAEIDGTEPKTLPFAEWPADDPMVGLCRTYDLAPADLAKLCRDLSRDLEARALRVGYDVNWTDA